MTQKAKLVARRPLDVGWILLHASNLGAEPFDLAGEAQNLLVGSRSLLTQCAQTGQTAG